MRVEGRGNVASFGPKHFTRVMSSEVYEVLLWVHLTHKEMAQKAEVTRSR